MNQHFYKPNPRNTGSACSFGVSGKSLFVSFVKQVSWNEEKKTGSFRENAKDPEKSINVKFTNVEAGGILNAIKTKTEYKIYHTSPKGVTTGSFKPYISKDGEDKGYSFTVFKQGNKNPFQIGFTHAETEVLILFLNKYIVSSFERVETNQESSSPTQNNVKTTPKVVKPAVVEEAVEETAEVEF